MGFTTAAPIDESTDINHQQTTNRTHDGDDITPESVNTDLAVIGETGYNPTTTALADDSVATVTVSSESIQLLTGNAGGVTGIFVSAFDSLITAATGSTVTNAGSTTLTGTTGDDGDLTVSRDGNDLNIENRTGSDVTVKVTSLDR
jgi:hypothetical protein